MKANINELDKLTESILQADFAKKKKQIINYKCSKLFPFVIMAVGSVYFLNAFIFMKRDRSYLKHSSNNIYMKRFFNLGTIQQREVHSPELYYRERAINQKNYAVAVNNFLADKDSYKLYTWS